MLVVGKKGRGPCGGPLCRDMRGKACWRAGHWSDGNDGAAGAGDTESVFLRGRGETSIIVVEVENPGREVAPRSPSRTNMK